MACVASLMASSSSFSGMLPVTTSSTACKYVSRSNMGSSDGPSRFLRKILRLKTNLKGWFCRTLTVTTSPM